jgi:carbon monoxide dehydrogenase subunit G
MILVFVDLDKFQHHCCTENNHYVYCMNLIFRVDKPINAVLDYLTDMEKYVSIHPVVSKIEHVEGNAYLVHETIKLGPFPYSFTYPVTIVEDAKNCMVIMKATVMGITKVDMVFKLTSEGDTTIINEAITISSRLPLKGTMEKVFRTQHQILFDNLNCAN